MSNGLSKDPDDFFADTRMTFGDHIEDLRSHLWRAIKGFLVALFLSFFIGQTVVNYITEPVRTELRNFYERRAKKILAERKKDTALIKANQPTPFSVIQVPRKQMTALAKGESPQMDRPRVVTKKEEEARQADTSALTRWYTRWFGDKPEDEGDPNETFYEIKEEDADKELVDLWIRYKEPLQTSGYLQDAQRWLLDIDSPTTLNVQEAFMVWFKVCVVCGIVIGSPWIFFQVWAFVAAGLYPHERRYVHVYLPVSLGLFLAGVFICEVFVIPKAIETLLWFNEWLGFKPDMRLSEWLGFAIFMPLIFGASFQTPLVMLFLAKLGIMDADSFRNKRRYAWFAMAVFAAVITPSTDALSMLFLWVPMSLLFELGIWLIKMTPKEPDLDIEVPDSEEMIEV
jgi:sec-independent protein translocase protein TatC